MLSAVITTIQEPTRSVSQLVDKLVHYQATLIVAGDIKGPPHYSPPEKNPGWPVSFLSLEEQQDGSYALGAALPTKHYARKNIAYLQAIAGGATCIYETDDDNAPIASWGPRTETVSDCLIIGRSEAPRWINVYRYFSEENIWPRGLPLNRISQAVPEPELTAQTVCSPIQQGLVNGSPDVDAIWRLVMDHPFDFDDKPSVYLSPGNWCPFNTQSTWWWPVAYPLLYIPSYCSFRMCDIWKSFIAQRCLWAMEMGITFHAPEVYQDRNIHDLQRDFEDEIPGYTRNHKIADWLMEQDLHPEPERMGDNLKQCYEALIQHDIFPEKEMTLVNLWLEDLAQATGN